MVSLLPYGLDPETVERLPQLTEALNVAKDGLPQVISAMRFSADPSIVAFLKKYDKGSDYERETYPWEVWATIAKVDIPQLLGNIMLALRTQSVNRIKIESITNHADVVMAGIQQAKSPKGFKDRQLLHSALGFTPQAKGPTFIGKYFAGQREDDGDNESAFTEAENVDVNAIFPSLNDTQKLLGE